MEQLTNIEKFILAYLWYEYGGALYFYRGTEEPEHFLARSILDEFVKGRPIFYDRVFQALVNGFKKLTQYWMIELRGYEIALTSYGKEVVKKISKEEYEKLKQLLSTGKI